MLGIGIGLPTYRPISKRIFEQSEKLFVLKTIMKYPEMSKITLVDLYLVSKSLTNLIDADSGLPPNNLKKKKRRMNYVYDRHCNLSKQYTL